MRRIVGVTGIKISYPTPTDDGGHQRAITIYTEDGSDLVIFVVTSPDTPELPVDVETPTDPPS